MRLTRAKKNAMTQLTPITRTSDANEADKNPKKYSLRT